MAGSGHKARYVALPRDFEARHAEAWQLATPGQRDTNLAAGALPRVVVTTSPSYRYGIEQVKRPRRDSNPLTREAAWTQISGSGR